MKSMPLNLKDAKKIHTDGKSSTFQLKSGHQIKIVHSALPALHKKQVEAMPVHKYAGGGYADPSNSSVQPESYDYVTNDDPNAPGAPPLPSNGDQGIPAAAEQDSDRAPAGIAQDIGAGIHNALAPIVQNSFSPIGTVLKQGGNFIKGLTSGQNTDQNTDGGQSSGLPPAASDLPGMGQPVAQVGNSGPRQPGSSVPMPGMPDISGAYKQGMNAIGEQQNVAEQMAKSRADLDNQYITSRQNLMQTAQQNLQDYQQHQKEFLNDYMNNQVNPNHYVENMSVPQKVASAIGMILGGAGAGAGRPNPGVEFLNQQINRDIQAQENRQGQNKTLLEANRQLYGDNVMATNATAANIASIYATQLQQAADRLGTPQAKAAADQAKSQLTAQWAPALIQNAIRGAVINGMRQNGGQGLNAIDLAHAGLMPQDEATKEQASIDAQRQGINQITGYYSQLAKLQTAGNRIANPIQSGQQIAALNADITNAVVSADASKRLTPESAKLEVMPFHVNLTDSPQTVAQKMNGVLSLVKEHAAGTTPYMEHYAPNSLPKYGAEPQQMQHRVGDILYVRGQKMQIADANGNLKPVR